MKTDRKRWNVNSSLAAPFRDATLETTMRERGFSVLELLVVVAVIMIVTAISMPSFLRAIRIYQLNDAATQVASVLKFTRYEAIRLNVSAAVGPGGPLSARVRQVGTITNVFTDSNYDTNVQNTEKQIQLTGNVNLVAAGTPPNTAGLAAAVGVAALTNVPLANGAIAFDQRGAITPAAVSVLYIGNLALPNLGYRAIVLLPTGSVQIWTTDSSGNWQQLN
jgi:Tfp pilus assembly protein FimT